MTSSRNSPYPFLPPLNRDKRGGTVQLVQDAIRDAIVRLDLPPGAFLDKNALCAQLRVSRFPVSEALGRLAAEGFVEILPQRGTLVSRINLDDCREAMFIRRALETDAVRALAPKASEELIKAFELNLGKQLEALKSDDRIRFHQLDLELHDLLLDKLGFERVKIAVYASRAKLDRMRLFMCTPARQVSTYEEHQRIFDAVAARDGMAAGAAMQHHLDIVMAELAAFSAKHPDAFAIGELDSAAA